MNYREPRRSMHLRVLRGVVPVLAVFVLTGGCEAQSRATPAPDASVAELRRFIEDSLPTAFSGQLILSVGDSIVLTLNRGLADSATRAPIDDRTLFDIGSVTKQFTAAAMLWLEDAGRLSVLDTLGKHLPGITGPLARVSIHELLTHTAGLPQYSGGDYDRVSRDSLVALMERAAAPYAVSHPFEYSNPGYGLLAVLIERLTGQDYASFLQRELGTRAGLVETGYVMPGPESRMARGYIPGVRWGTPRDSAWAPEGPWWNLRGNGGLLSTAADLWRWQRALIGGRVLSPDATTRLFQPYAARVVAPNVPRRWYGYGWEVSDTRAGRLVGHTGGNRVFFSLIYWWRDRDVTLVVTNNTFDAATIGALLRSVVQWTEQQPARAR
jgi:CubicO group peptidase (beta-lactamase class C family)